ncbi:tetratricopeptide repeat protein [Brevundimonas bacteroides]|uniref:tetratricopeptide repeat protein n=1 Tax=Brevundimonas bacteroides TaxID=74311 RepID=UPI000496220A|nr:tetratricopeptide repeat protein [Brevundimonas bacteroides]
MLALILTSLLFAGTISSPALISQSNEDLIACAGDGGATPSDIVRGCTNIHNTTGNRHPQLFAARGLAYIQLGDWQRALADLDLAAQGHDQYRYPTREMIADARALARRQLGMDDDGAGAAAAGQCRMTPDQTMAAFEADFGVFVTQYPMPSRLADGSAPGPRATYQYSYFLGTEGLRLIQPYLGCLGPHEQPNVHALTVTAQRGLEGCEQLSTVQGSCTPSYPF